MDLSIVIPTAKRADLLKQTLDSIYANTNCKFEVIVVANSPNQGFTYCVEKLVNNYKNTIFCSFNRYKGYVVPCNTGASYATGEFLTIMNDDVITCLNWYELLTQKLENTMMVEQVGPALQFHDGKFNHVTYASNYPYIEGWCFMVRRKFWEKLGGFDTGLDFAYCEDSDLSYNIIQRGYRIRYQEHRSNNKDYLVKKWNL